MERRSNLWAQASAVAAKTPESRNRYVDFLRALSICAVVIGHWLVAAPFFTGGEVTLHNMLEYQPWTQWLTWLFQVMPVFFIVGGYSNGISWNAAIRDGKPYGEWLRGRLQRLVGPMLPLLVVWIVLGAVGHQMGVSAEMVKVASQMALIPIWFLAVYVMVVVVVPLTYSAWQRFGMWSFFALAAAVVLDDFLFFAADLHVVGWFNYGFIWLAVHQFGYAWRDGHIAGPTKALLWTAGGLAVMVGLITVGPHPISMVSVPGEGVSNSLPPKLPLLVLGIAQGGLLLSMEGPLRRWLARGAPWTATVLVNGMIMTVFLWHLTASTLTIGAATLLGGVGLEAEPGSGMWWLLRPIWFCVYMLVLAVFSLVFGRFERGGGKVSGVAAWRSIVGAILVCGGLSLIALNGIGGDGFLGLRVWVLVLPFAGAVVASINPLARA
ncbi:acyltransferase family protein, partial [Gemmatimonadota bacterium]